MNAPTKPRYVSRFQNGVHQVFDTIFYAPVDVKPSAALAQRRADELNARPRPARKGGRK